MTEGQIKLAERIGELLAQSLLEDEVKNSIMERVEDIPEHLLFKLLDALELENEEGDRVAFEINMFLKEQDEDWDKTKNEQKKFADDAIDKIANALS